MKKIYLPILFSLILGTGWIYAQSPSMVIKTWTNDNKSVMLSSISKITFSGDDMVLHYTANQIENIGLSSVRSILFNQSGTGLENIHTIKNDIGVYPNPATDYLILKNIPEGKCIIDIYTVSGVHITRTSIQSKGQTIDVSQLQNGMYILKANNEVYKFTKQ
ncbi:T9SS C-terminal target domain-containing protein [Dysgonomonas sp. 216]|uniref:T9SS type A sorting domain-containing protein n=1 Tax=Dysgonomonas sp. 216 TaxID=2302934 RepID=UPI0013D46378|nr:T9SS type A sorting domain-containing protein [Dysgonomonas sp. 216]NDW19144.1 T9SS C-terminal target domain-containing protein [Dysgonomonas sp. 216]